ncbi:hypothetical protein D3C85_817630 [compost metagenome]
MHVAQHVLDGVVGLDAGVEHAAVAALVDVHRIGVAEQVVHVAEDLLVGADQEHAEQVVLALAQRMHRQAGLDALLVDVVLDLAVGVAGQVLQHRASLRLLIEAMDRQDRQNLVDRPGVRQALEHREVADVLVGQLVVELVEHRAVRALARLQLVVQAPADGEVALLGQRLLRQRQLAGGILRSRLADEVGGAPVGLGDHLRIARAEQVDQRLQRLRLLQRRIERRHAVVVALDVGDLHHQHGVVGGHRPAALGEDVRVRQLLAVAELLEHVDHGGGVVVHVVVDRAGVARVGAVVVDAQAAADVDVVDRQAEGAQLAVVADRLAKALAVVGDVGDLRAHVEVQQADALVEAGGAEALDHRQQLGGGQAELGLLAAGVGPLGGRQRGQPHAQADLRGDAEGLGLLNHQRHLGFLLDDDEQAVTELLADQRQADELAVLVAVADDGAALRRQRQHGQQLGLGAGFQADGDVLGGDDVLHHRLLLVDLDRVQRGVAVAVAETGDIGVEGAGELAHAILEDAGKAHQQRQRQPGSAQLADQVVQIDGHAVGTLRADLDVAGLVDREVAGAPVADAVDPAAVGHAPVAACSLAFCHVPALLGRGWMPPPDR